MITFDISRKRKEDDLLNTCNHLLISLNVNFTSKGLSETLRGHSDYPSLLALKDSLSAYGIQSEAIRKGKYRYEDFETPFISSIQKEGWPKANFTIVTRAESDRVEFLDPLSNKRDTISMKQFGEIDKNVILLLDTSTPKDENNFIENRKRERTSVLAQQIPLYLVGVAFFMAAIAILLQPPHVASWYSFSFLLTSFVGLGITSLLLWHEIDAHNPFIKEVCGGGNSKLNCDAVLGSSSSSFLGISWSVWGFAFFATFFTTQVFFPGSLGLTMLWSGLSLAAAPYIVFSVYHQWFVIRQWCRLCLGVQVVLGINTVIAGLFITRHAGSLVDYLTVYSTGMVALIGLTFLFLAYIAVPIFKSANDSKSYEQKWKNLRYNREIFQTLLEKSERITFPADNLGIVIGNPDAQNEIIKVCNPYCGPCSKAHPELEHIIRVNTNVRLKIIFTASGKTEDIKTNAVKLFLAVRDKYGSEMLKGLLDEWYNKAMINFEEFENKYEINVNEEDYMEEISSMKKWCDEMKIRATPTIFINGKELPDSYRVTDLKNFF